MPGYLDQYGAGEEKRERLYKRLAAGAVLVLIAVGVLYFFLKNYRQERQVRQFFQDLQKGDYKAGYALWGCTDEKPCRDYPFPEFMKDWGPQSPRANASALQIRKSRSCGSGVIITIDGEREKDEKLWVQRNDLTIGFSPWPGCPAGQ